MCITSIGWYTVRSRTVNVNGTAVSTVVDIRLQAQSPSLRIDPAPTPACGARCWRIPAPYSNEFLLPTPMIPCSLLPRIPTLYSHEFLFPTPTDSYSLLLASYSYGTPLLIPTNPYFPMDLHPHGFSIFSSTNPYSPHHGCGQAAPN